MGLINCGACPPHNHCSAGNCVCDAGWTACDGSSLDADGCECDISGTNVCWAGACCAPTTCAANPGWCGDHDDGCGVTINCVACPLSVTSGTYNNCMPTNDCGVDEPSCGMLFNVWGGCCIPPFGTTIFTLDQIVYIYPGINTNTLTTNINPNYGFINTDLYVGQTSAGQWVYIGSINGAPQHSSFSLETIGLPWVRYVRLINTARQVCHGGGAFHNISVNGSNN